MLLNTYQLEIFQFPTIRSNHHFSIIYLDSNSSDFSTEKEAPAGSLLCNTFQVNLTHSESNFVFRLPPSPWQSVVQVYISPPHCKTWKKLLPTEKYGMKVINALGETIFDPVLDYRLRWTELLQQASSLSWSFVYCTESLNTDLISLVDDFATIIHADFRSVYQSIPTIPVTLVF